MRAHPLMPALFLTLFLCQHGSANEHAAIEALWTDDQPTGAEIENLSLLNRLRADPQAEIDRIIIQGQGHPRINWQTLLQETRELQAVPATVWNQELTIAARQHIRHCLATGRGGHSQQAGRPYYVSANPSERMRAAGYKGTPRHENWAAFDSPSLAHSAWFIDNRGRDVGHRAALIAPNNREVGIAIGVQGLQNFGSPKGNSTLVGVIVYVDRNGDGRYNAGEGVAGVEIRSGDSVVTTGDAGYARLELDPQAPRRISAHIGNQEFHHVLDDASSHHWEIRLNDPGLRNLERLVERAESQGSNNRRRSVDLFALVLQGEQVFYDQAMAERIKALAGVQREQIANLRASLVSQLNSNPQALIDKAPQWKEDFAGSVYAPVIPMIEQMAQAKLALSQGAAEDVSNRALQLFRAVADECPDPRIALRARAEAILLAGSTR